MLLSFNFSNFHSFNEETEFVMSAGPTKRHLSHIAEVNGISTLKYSTIYGANAAGKSSLIKAFKCSRNMIRGEPVTHYINEYCRSIPGNDKKPTSFEYFFENKGRFFQFGFESILPSKEFTSEWLYEVTSNDSEDVMNETLIYNIERKNGVIEPNWSYFEDESEKIRLNQILHDHNLFNYIDENEVDDDSDEEAYDTLFLSKLRGKKFDDLPRLDILRDVLKWFSNKLKINNIQPPTDEDLSEACRYMSHYDTDLSKGEYRFESDVTSNIHANTRMLLKENKPLFLDNGTKIILENGSVNLYMVHTKHNSTDVDFKINEESSGTRQGLNIVNTLFNSKDDDVTYIFDEFGMAMHPLLISAILKDYQEYNIDKTNQLIMATHHTSIMSYNHLRRDEIWFVDKEKGISRIYSLEDFTERPDAEISKRYLEGRYGALPIFTQLDFEADDAE